MKSFIDTSAGASQLKLKEHGCVCDVPHAGGDGRTEFFVWLQMLDTKRLAEVKLSGST